MIRTATLLAGLFCAQVALAGEAELSRGPYLQLATPESMVVVWRTRGASRPAVRIGRSPDALQRTIRGQSVLTRVSADVDAAADVLRLYKEPTEHAAERHPRDEDPSTAPDTYQYEAHIAKLAPSTRYYYAVYDGQRRLAGGDAQHFFVTSPRHGSDADMRIWVVGDSGTGEQDQKDVYRAMQEFTNATGRELDLYLHLGDMAYGDGTDRQFQRNFFDVYQPTLAKTVCWPTMGNHEGHTSRGISGFGPYYDAYVVPTAAEAGGLPSGSEAYYSFDVADVHFVCLNSHDLDRSPDAAMAQWLVADLEQAQGDWLIAFFHHPPYSKGSHDSDLEQDLTEMRANIMPILEAGGVDLVLAGHSHIYERSMLIDGAYATPTTAKGVVLDDGDGNPDGDGAYRKSKGLHPHEGTVAVVAGHGGAGISRRGTMPVMRETILEHGSVVLDIQGDALTGVMVNKNNVARDLFRIVKQGSVKVARIADPWQPAIDYSQITRFLVTFHEETIGGQPSKWRVVRGRNQAATIEAQSGGSAKQLAVAAGSESVVAVYADFEGDVADFDTRMTIAGDATAPSGLVLALQDPQNYYVFRFDRASRVAECVRIRDGEEKILSRRTLEVDPANPIRVKLEPFKDNLEVHVQGVEYMVNLDQPLPAGKLGVYVGAGGRASFPSFGINRARP